MYQIMEGPVYFGKGNQNTDTKNLMITLVNMGVYREAASPTRREVKKKVCAFMNHVGPAYVTTVEMFDKDVKQSTKENSAWPWKKWQQDMKDKLAAYDWNNTSNVHDFCMVIAGECPPAVMMSMAKHMYKTCKMSMLKKVFLWNAGQLYFREPSSLQEVDNVPLLSQPTLQVDTRKIVRRWNEDVKGKVVVVNIAEADNFQRVGNMNQMWNQEFPEHHVDNIQIAYRYAGCELSFSDWVTLKGTITNLLSNFAVEYRDEENVVFVFNTAGDNLLAFEVGLFMGYFTSVHNKCTLPSHVVCLDMF